jgi:hypothetical protein
MNEISELPGFTGYPIMADEMAVMSDWQGSLALGDAE